MSIEKYISQKVNKINKNLSLMIPENNTAEKAANYTLLAPGNRWRPLLTLALAEEYKNPYPDLDKLSCAPECLHAASIILDDLPCMDNASLRRGKETCHIKYKESDANLAIITLINTAWGTINAFSPDIYRKILLEESYKIGKEMIKAQTIDLQNLPKKQTDILKMYIGKSGELFALSTILGTFHEWTIKDSYKFGHQIGIAYQIADDIQDALSDEKKIGKNVNQDKNKPTIVKTLGITFARKKAKMHKEKAIKLIKGKKTLESLLDKIIEII